MATYEALRERYRGRRRDALVDTVTVGLTCADEMMLDMGLLDGLGDSVKLLDGVLDALPFVFIVASEGAKVALGRKAITSAAKHAAFRATKTGAAMAVGAGVAIAAGGLAALPVAVAVHLVFERCKSKILLNRRLKGRIETLRFLQKKWLPAVREANTDEAFSRAALPARAATFTIER